MHASGELTSGHHDDHHNRGGHDTPTGNVVDYDNNRPTRHHDYDGTSPRE